MKNVIPIIILILSLVFTSCNNDDDDKKPVLVPTRTELLTAKSWVLTAKTERPANTTGNETDIFTTFSNCRKDDIFTFKTDSTIFIDEGILKCNPGDPQTRNKSRWELFQNDTKLREIFSTVSGSSQEFEIITLTASTLVLEQNGDISGTSKTYKATYSAQ